jgi:aminoglycoside phosphotransferase (APT) family kinase protein
MKAHEDGGSLAAALEAYLVGELGADAKVMALEPMADGHAGLTYGFELSRSHAAPAGFVLKVAPRDVRRSGSTDLFRQVRLLRALKDASYPAPAVRWASSNDALLGAQFIVMERLPGQTLIVWEPAPSLFTAGGSIEEMWFSTARLMGQLHGLDWRSSLRDWERPATIENEVERWARLLRHAPQNWRELASPLLEALRRSAPEDEHVGLVHGDLQPGNVLFEQGAPRGVVDWDLAAIAPQGLDIGWLLMIADQGNWTDAWRAKGAPSRDGLIEAYRCSGGTVSSRLEWYQAFAHFRMAAIAGLNLKLHRDGRRVDPTWEKFALSVPLQLERGIAMLN